jgi:hypothetical protein
MYVYTAYTEQGLCELSSKLVPYLKHLGTDHEENTAVQFL